MLGDKVDYVDLKLKKNHFFTYSFMNYKDLAQKNESWIRSGWGSLESQSNRHNYKLRVNEL